jgi:RNA polymerase sigma-70 factor, ECF subfamily
MRSLKNRSPEALPDETLAQRLKHGDRSAFVTLYERHKRYVYLFCVKMLGDRESAGDVTQGVFLKLLERHQQLADPSKFKSWLLMIARNDCITQMKHTKTTVSAEEYEEDVIGIADSQDSSLETEQRLQTVNLAIQKLQPAYKEVIILREYQNLSYKQIADVIGQAESTVRFRLFAARRQLYETLKPLLGSL